MKNNHNFYHVFSEFNQKDMEISKENDNFLSVCVRVVSLVSLIIAIR